MIIIISYCYIYILSNTDLVLPYIGMARILMIYYILLVYA